MSRKIENTEGNENINNNLFLEIKSNTAIVVLHNPKKKNALTDALLADLSRTLKTLAENDGVRCLVVRGWGDEAFSSGYDIGAIHTGASPVIKPKTPDILIRALAQIKAFPYPTIAMLNGVVFGAGFNLCACCDLRIAAHDVRMGMTPARIGVAYHPEGIQQFIEAFGLARTKEIFYTAKTFQGIELLDKGLVHYQEPRDNLEAFTREFARQIAGNAPLSLKSIKQTIALFEKKMALAPDALARADQLMQICFQSQDLKEGQAAFLEKRHPKFSGR